MYCIEVTGDIGEGGEGKVRGEPQRLDEPLFQFWTLPEEKEEEEEEMGG